MGWIIELIENLRGKNYWDLIVILWLQNSFLRSLKLTNWDSNFTWGKSFISHPIFGKQKSGKTETETET